MEQAGLRLRRALPRTFAASSVFFAALLAGCANPGPPRSPSLQLPEMVSDLSAERIGDRVHLRWTTPSRTTDGLDIKGALAAEICRSAGAPPPKTNAASKKAPPACIAVQKVPTSPGAASAWDDLPQALLADPVGLLTYRIQILNAAGRSAGASSSAAFAASGAAPAPVDSLTASASEAGGVLTWKAHDGGEALLVDLARTDLAQRNSPSAAGARRSSAPVAAPARHGKGARSNQADADFGEIHLRARAEATVAAADGLAGTVDTSAEMGENYRYVAEQVRVVTLDGRTLEIRSQPTVPVTLAMRDTFPPKAPTGLATIPGETEALNGSSAISYIDLSWEPNSEPDLAGYFVYRQLARPNGDPQGPLGKMTPLPIAAPAYRDVAVAPGQRYIYLVTAVDASGNESAPSAKAQEVAAAQNVGSPH